MKNMEIQIKIENFEGPLDLLIHLIEKKQMKISEINISQIIDDYLSIHLYCLHLIGARQPRGVK